MHIMEGFLPPLWCLIYYIICIPCIVYGIMQIRKVTAETDEAMPMLALSGAFMFILSSLKMPSVTGSCSHPCGNGFGAVFFGPAVVGVLSVIVLVFQAVILAHGGITTLGANVLSMGIIGPLCGYAVWLGLRKLNVNDEIAMFFTAFVADLMTYVVTAIELSLAFPKPDFFTALVTFLGIFAVTQIPLAIAEGILTMVIYRFIKQQKPDILVKLRVISKEEAGVN